MTLTPEQDLENVRAGRDLSCFDLYSVDQLSLTDLGVIFEIARKFREYKTYKFNLSKGSTQINCFFENSTRTLASFDLAAKHLSMDTTSVGGSSSVKKGESYLDTAQTLDAYNSKVIVIRSTQSWVAQVLSRHVAATVINAGWKIVTIVGDIMHSRVFGSQVRLLKQLWANIRVACPMTLWPAEVEKFGVEMFTDIEKALVWVDIVSALRMQEERWATGFIPSLREYSKMYGISKKRLELAAKDAILIHPGPVIRDIDIHSALSAVDEQSYILRQVENGLAIRKALIWLFTQRCDGKTKTFTRK